MQAESMRTKYIASRGEIDKIRGNLHESGKKGEGAAYGGDQLRTFANTSQDAYMYLVLQDEDQVSEFAQSFDDGHAGTSSKTPKTNGKEPTAKKPGDQIHPLLILGVRLTP